VTHEQELAVAMRADLERRVGEISRADSRTFGQIGVAEWALAAVGFVVVPLVLWWWFR
jgi:uncharacterized protein (UPF0218 family)